MPIDHERLTPMEECLKTQKTGGDPEYDKRKMAEIRQEYEESIKHKSMVEPRGIKPVNITCKYPVIIGEVQSGVCTEDEAGKYYTPKHIDTPEEVLAKYYAGVYKDQREVCSEKYPVECADPPKEDENECRDTENQYKIPKPLMVAKPDIPAGECKRKTVTFFDDKDKCNIDRNDLCDLKTEKAPYDCTKYP